LTSYTSQTTNPTIKKFSELLTIELQNSTQCALITDTSFNLFPLGENFCFVAHEKYDLDMLIVPYLEQLIYNISLSSSTLLKKPEIKSLLQIITRESYGTMTILADENKLATTKTQTYSTSQVTNFIKQQFNTVDTIKVLSVSNILYNQLVAVEPNFISTFQFDNEQYSEKVYSILEVFRRVLYDQLNNFETTLVKKLLLYEFGENFSSFQRIINPLSMYVEVTSRKTSFKLIGAKLTLFYNPNDPLEKFADDLSVEIVKQWLENGIKEIK
jgi:hypothetical protein